MSSAPKETAIAATSWLVVSGDIRVSKLGKLQTAMEQQLRLYVKTSIQPIDNEKIRGRKIVHQARS